MYDPVDNGYFVTAGTLYLFGGQPMPKQIGQSSKVRPRTQEPDNKCLVERQFTVYLFITVAPDPHPKL